MKWLDEGFIVRKQLFGERYNILNIFTKDHGMMRGLFPKSKRNFFDIGCFVSLSWQSRLEDQLGFFSCERIPPYITVHPYAIANICYVLKLTMPERHPYPDFYAVFVDILAHQSSNCVGFYIYFELALLKYLGFEIDFSECTVTKSKDDLIYISPNTGKAVCGSVGYQYREKLLKLPSFLREGRYHDLSETDFREGLELTGYFLQKYFGKLSDIRYLLHNVVS